jgi:hypothetical protein
MNRICETTSVVRDGGQQQIRLAFDTSPPTDIRIITSADITDNDVLLCKTTIASYHKGNVRYQKIIQRVCSQYITASTSDMKRKVAKAVVAGIQYTNGRFLQRMVENTRNADKNSSVNQWVEVANDVAVISTERALLKCSLCQGEFQDEVLSRDPLYKN